LDFQKAYLKIQEMEEYIKSMNADNDRLKGKLGNLISNNGSPHENNMNKFDNNDEYYYNSNQDYNEIIQNKQKVKKKNNPSSYIYNNSIEEFKKEYKTENFNINNPQFINDIKPYNMKKNQNEMEESNNKIDYTNNEYQENLENISNNDNPYSYNNQTIYQSENKIGFREPNSNIFKWNRHLTLGKNSLTNIVNSTDEINSFNNNDDSNNLNNNHNNNQYKINPFIINSSTFINNDYENINDKIRNMNIENIYNIDNTNNLEDIEQLENEDDSEDYNVVEFPLQLKMKHKKKNKL